MARAGLYKSDVKKARDALLAKGQRPSIDAVRIELGNTGSKTTIHRYLRELEDEYGAADEKRTSLSDALADLVERLATRLQEEADDQYAVRCQDFETQAREYDVALQSVQVEGARLAAHVTSLEATNREQKAALAAAQEALARELTARQLAEQHSAGLTERLTDNEAHRRSLEEKHQHARDALEHYRQAAKEQRDADLRRHEQQIQQLQAELRQANQHLAVKREETMQLNRDGARLIAELSHARQAQHASEDTTKRQAHEIEHLHKRQANYEQLRTHVAERDVRIAALQEELASSARAQEELTQQQRDLVLALTQAQTQAQMLEKLNGQLQTLIASGQPQAARTARPAE